MKKISYTIAAIYQGINLRVKNDTPYFNTLMLIVFAIIIHIIQLLIILKIKGVDILQAINKPVFITLFVLLVFLIIYFLRKIFPLKEIASIEVRQNDKRRFYNGMIIYFLVSISLMVILLVNLKHHLGL